MSGIRSPMMYRAYQAYSDLMEPVRAVARFAQETIRSPLNGFAESLPLRTMAAGFEMLSRADLTHQRPSYNLNSIMVGNREVAVTEEKRLVTPFGTLLRFRKDIDVQQPRVLLVAPLSGHYATLLIIHIAHTEDAARYRGPVRFWNSQLVETLGLPSDRALRTAIRKAVEFGVLHFERRSNRQVGNYFVKIPPDWEGLDDSPIEPIVYRNAVTNAVTNEGANGFKDSGFMPDSCTEKRRIHALSSNPIPFPDPIPEEQDAPDIVPRKKGRSPPALISDLPPFEELERYWNETLGGRHTIEAMTEMRMVTIPAPQYVGKDRG